MLYEAERIRKGYEIAQKEAQEYIKKITGKPVQKETETETETE